MPLALSQHPLAEGARPPFEAGRKLGAVAMALGWQLLHEDPECPSRVVRDTVAQRQVPIAVRVRHRNWWRAKWKLHRRTGRPGHTALIRPGWAGGAVVQGTPHLSCVGVHLGAPGLDQQESVAQVVARLMLAIEVAKQTPPDDAFALGHQRAQTLVRRLQALCFAPLGGLEPWTGCDTHEPPLQTRRGRGYHRSTRTPWLGQLERIEAAAALMPARVPDTAGQLPDVAGPLIASGSRGAMHKGHSTRLGRIRAGSQGVIAHNEAGPALLVADYPPAIHVSQVLVASCHQGAWATGTARLVSDRAVNAVAIACAVDNPGLGWRSLRDENAHEGLDRFEATAVDTREEGTRV